MVQPRSEAVRDVLQVVHLADEPTGSNRLDAHDNLPIPTISILKGNYESFITVAENQDLGDVLRASVLHSLRGFVRA